MPSGDSSASPVVDLLLSRRSLVAEMHVPPGPSPEELDTILRCATRVPDHKRLTPWRIKVYVGEAKARLGRIFQDAYRASHPDASPDELATEAGRPNRAPGDEPAFMPVFRAADRFASGEPGTVDAEAEAARLVDCVVEQSRVWASRAHVAARTSTSSPDNS